MYHLLSLLVHYAVLSTSYFTETKAKISDQHHFVDNGYRYRCSRTKNFSHPMNCDLFLRIQCVDTKEEVLLETCPPGQLFDATSKSCQAEKQVDCSRHLRYKVKGDGRKSPAGMELRKTQIRKKREELDLNRRSKPWGKFVNGTYIPYLVVQGEKNSECKDINLLKHTSVVDSVSNFTIPAPIQTKAALPFGRMALGIVNWHENKNLPATDTTTLKNLAPIQTKAAVPFGRMALGIVYRREDKDLSTTDTTTLKNVIVSETPKKAEPELVYDDEISEPESILPAVTAKSRTSQAVRIKMGRKAFMFLDDDVAGPVKGQISLGRFINTKFLVATQKPNEAMDFGVEDEEM